MDSTIITALFTCFGTIAGSGLTLLANNKTVNFRLEQIEKKLDEQAGVLTRLAVVEEKIAALEGK